MTVATKFFMNYNVIKHGICRLMLNKVHAKENRYRMEYFVMMYRKSHNISRAWDNKIMSFQIMELKINLY